MESALEPAEMLERLLSNGARTIIVESPDRFARDLMVQLAGHDMLKARGVTLVAAPAPTHFVEDTPTAILVRQVLLRWARSNSCCPSSVRARLRVLRAIRHTSARRSSVDSRLLTTLSARPISRLAADRLPAATIRTKVRSSVMSSSMPPSHFPIGGE